MFGISDNRTLLKICAVGIFVMCAVLLFLGWEQVLPIFQPLGCLGVAFFFGFWLVLRNRQDIQQSDFKESNNTDLSEVRSRKSTPGINQLSESKYLRAMFVSLTLFATMLFVKGNQLFVGAPDTVVLLAWALACAGPIGLCWFDARSSVEKPRRTPRS